MNLRQLRPSASPKELLARMDDELLDEHKSPKVLPAEVYRAYPADDLHFWLLCHGFYGIPTLELVNWLRHELPKSSIEIGAGNGAFGRTLGIPMTDNKCQNWPDVRLLYEATGQPTIPYPEDVEELDALEAVRKYQPSTVFGSWVTQWIDPAKPPPLGGGSIYGIKERELLALVDTYIVVGNLDVHGSKAIRTSETHRLEEITSPFLVSRGNNQALNRVFVWRRSV